MSGGEHSRAGDHYDPRRGGPTDRYDPEESLHPYDLGGHWATTTLVTTLLTIPTRRIRGIVQSSLTMIVMITWSLAERLREDDMTTMEWIEVTEGSEDIDVHLGADSSAR